MNTPHQNTAHYHLPGLFQFYELYKNFLPLYRNKREFFYDWCDIASIYGSPQDCLWGGGRTSFGQAHSTDVFALMQEYEISPRLTFSNSLLAENHLADKKCNSLCKLFEKSKVPCGVIIHSDLLLDYLKNNYPSFYYVSSTTKVLTSFNDFQNELNRDEFKFVVPDFRLNKNLEKLKSLSQTQKDKVEFLCNECCDFGCKERKICYENVSRKNLGIDVVSHKCTAQNSEQGYRFSGAMKNPGFIGLDEIQNIYIPLNFTNFKIEGRGLGSAIVLEFLLYYLIKPEYQLEVREIIYLDSMLDLF